MQRRAVPDDWHRKQIEQKGRQCAALFQVKSKKWLMAEPGARPCRRLVLCNIWLTPSSVVLFSIVQKAVGEEHG